MEKSDKYRKEIEAMSQEGDSSYLTLIDLMAEIWDASYSATKNIRLLIAVVSRNLGRTETDTRRMREGREMKRILMEMYKAWVTQGSMDSVCPKREMQRFVRYDISKDLHAQLVRGLMSEETYGEWVDDYRKYIEDLETGKISATRMLATTEEGRCKDDNDNDDDEEEVVVVEEGLDATTEEGRCKDDDDDDDDDEEEVVVVEAGLDALFKSEVERNAKPIAQNIIKVENGRLFALKTPGEAGSQLVRVNVYDVRDLVNRDKRNWWKCSKLRAQFLCSSTKADRKQRLLRQLFDVVSNDLRSVPGVESEMRDLFNADNSFLDRVDRKRKRCGEPTESNHDDVIATAYGAREQGKAESTKCRNVFNVANK